MNKWNAELKNDFIQALIKNFGSISNAALAVDVTANSVYRRFRIDPKFKTFVYETIDIIKQNFKDEVESAFMKAVSCGNWKAIERGLDSYGMYLPKKIEDNNNTEDIINIKFDAS